MSRSRKKTALFTDGSDRAGSSRQYYLRQAARKVRHSKDVPDGGSFKKLYCSYNICDFKFDADPDDPTSIRKARQK